MKRLLFLLGLFVCCLGSGADARLLIDQFPQGAPQSHGFGIKVKGNKFVSTTDGHQIQLLGVSISGLEQGATALNTSNGNYQFVADPGFAAMASWNMNVVRIPMNAETWLGVNSCITDAGPAAALHTNLKQMVANANAAGLYVILDLHWTSPNAFISPGHVGCPVGQPSMPDADNATNFWASIANTFKGNPAVMFEIFNEPYATGNYANSVEARTGSIPTGQSAVDLNIMVNGGTYNQFYYQCNQNCPAGESAGSLYSTAAINPFRVAGTQAIVTAIRSTGAKNVIISPSMWFDGDNETWLSNHPADPARQMAAAWHEDDGSTNDGSTILAAGYPMVITEAYNCTAAASHCVASAETLNGTTYTQIANGYVDNNSNNVFPWAMTNKVGFAYFAWVPWSGGILQNTTNYAPNALGATLDYAYCSQAQTNGLASCVGPTVTSTLTASGTVGTTFSYQIAGTKFPTAFNATPLPSGLSINTATGVISGTPTAAATTNVTISALNVLGTGTATLVLTVSPAGAAVVTVDANASAPLINSTGSSINFNNLTVGTGQLNYALVASIDGFLTGSVTSMTWGSQAMTRIIAFQDPFGNFHEMWGLIAPASGNQTLAVVLSGSAQFVDMNATSFYNVNQTGGTTTFYNSASASGTGANSTITVSSFAGDVVIDAASSPGSTQPSLPLGTQLWTATGGDSGVGSYLAGNSSITLGWTLAGPGSNWVEIATGIKEGGTGAAPVINSPLTASGIVGAPFNYTITATNSPASFNATGLPGGLSVATATGVISGTPTTAATTNVPISATNAGGTGSATLVTTITTLPPGFYVATTGSDSNAGTITAPFATLGKCQTAMQGSGTKTCYIRAGSYAPAGLNACNSRGNCAVGLGSSDNGETWSYYPPDGYDSADITGGSTASGNGLWAIFYTGGATGVTINGLSLHNFDFAAIQSGGGANLTVSNNLIFNGFGIVGDVSLSGASNAGGFMCYDCVGLTINNNVIHDIASFGMTNAHSAGLISNYLVQSNVLYNTCSQYRDCGAIYSQDLNTTKSTNLKVVNNYVLDGCIASGCAPGSGGWGAGIYLDDCTNNYTITGNIVTGNNGTNNLMIHGGSNNSWSDNLFDLGPLNSPVLRFQSSSCSAPTGNTFQNNIIISDGASGGYNSTGGTVTVANNAYWNYGSGTLTTSGDSSPLTENPLMPCNTYAVGAGSAVLNSPVSFTALPTSWGPPGYTIPATGTPRSTSVSCAIAANTFLSSMGVNIHIGQGYSESAYEPEFTYTGIRNARDYAAQWASYITLHNNTISGTYPGVMMDLLADSPSHIVSEATPLVTAGAFLSAEGPNEPNNFTITYLGNTGGGSGTWVPVAQFQRDLYSAVKGNSTLTNYPVFGPSEIGAETDNVGLQCLVLNSSCPGASSVTLMAANTIYENYSNNHNYVSGNGACLTPAANQSWNAEDPQLNSCWDGVYGDNVSTWNHHYLGYTTTQVLTLPKVTTETGWNSDSPSLDYQGKILVLTYLDAYKRGYAYTFVYEMVDQQGSSSNQGLYTTGNVAKLSATYVHNLTTVLADTTNFAPIQLNYSIASEPATVHDMLLQNSNGVFYLLIWDEQTTTGTTDNITVSLGSTHTVTEYDTTVGTSPVATFTNVTSVPLTLSDHAVILKIP